MKQYRSFLKNFHFKDFDFTLFFTVLIIAIIGIITIYSAVFEGPKEDNKLWVLQIIRLVIGLIALIIVFVIDYRILNGIGYILYILGFILLATVLAFPEQSGARRWIMGGAFQPSELARIILIIALAQYLNDKKEIVGEDKVFFTSGGLILTYTFMIFMQPSLGYALTLIPVSLAMLYLAGANRTYLLMVSLVIIISASMTILILHRDWDFKSASALLKILLMTLIYIAFVLFIYYLVSKTRIKKGKRIIKFFAPCIIVGVVLAMMGSIVLKDYQKARLIAFVDANSDPAGSGYHIIQSKIAIGSGGILGQGYLHGTQNRLDFLPAQHTDFIFSVIAEEWGFFGSLIILALYFTLIMNGLKAAAIADNLFGVLLATGIVTMITTQMFLNLGVTLGLMPITGVPLPLISYGGSSLFATFVSIGLLLNVRLRR
jgi:rod shape determining protein RodA